MDHGNPTIYRAGLAVQTITPNWKRWKVTAGVGLVTTLAALFPALVMNLLGFVAGRPPVMTAAVEQADAVLWAGLPGYEGAAAVADVLIGTVVPSGRLPFSWPRGPSTQLAHHHKPSALYHFRENADVFDDHRHPTLYPFGHGLSYTRFAYRDLALSDTLLGPEGTLTAAVTVENTGGHAAREPVLWFVTDEVGRLTRPARLLRHVDAAELTPGETARLTFEIDSPRNLAYPDAAGRAVLEPGRFTVTVGGQAATFRLAE